jgi:uncharacterized protein (TIGR02449 family)
MSLDEKMSLLENRIDALVKATQKVREQNDFLKQKELELLEKNNLVKKKVEEMILKLKLLDHK